MDEEKTLEKRLRLETEKLGAMAVKMTSQFHRGMPDRIILIPGGRTVFAELKTKGRKPTRLQSATMDRLRKMGFRCEVIDSEEKLRKLIDDIGNDIQTA